MQLHNVFAGRQADPGAVFLGGIIEVKYPFLLLRRHTLTVVADIHQDTFLYGAGANADVTVFIDGLEGVQDQIEQDLLKLVGVSVNQIDFFLQVGTQLDIAFNGLLLDEQEGVLDNPVDIDQGQVDRFGFGQIQKLGNDPV